MTIEKRDETDQILRDMTEARVRLGRFGAGMPTGAMQSFLLDHARAREAVWSEMSCDEIAAELGELGLSHQRVKSAAPDRPTYIRRPDLGRVLSREGNALLAAGHGEYDLAIVIGDGLSATAVDINAIPVVRALLPKLKAMGMRLAPVVLAQRARVALGDPIAATLGAEIVIMLIGERPGLSASDSLGAYVTYKARPGTPDSARNCVSNIREGGLAPESAAAMLALLIGEMRNQKLSGVKLQRSLSVGDGAVAHPAVSALQSPD